jgi:phosphate transport system substrate-binding protein
MFNTSNTTQSTASSQQSKFSWFDKAEFGVAGLMCILVAFVLIVTNCGDKPDPNVETDTTGTAEILCDASLVNFLKPAFAMYDSAYPQAHVTVRGIAAREGMAQLFAGKARGVIIAREYLHDEDSLMKAFKVAPYEAVTLAEDALVLYAKPEFPLDTLSVEQVKAFFTDKTATLKSAFPALKTEPSVVCAGATSSEYGNVMTMLAGGKAPLHLQFRATSDSVFSDVTRDANTIGIGYLSQLAGKANVKDVKLLRIGFTDSTGTRITPKPVHQSYVVMGKYPFVVKINGLLLENRRNLPWGFFQFLRNDNETKKFFLQSGIIPQNAKFNLTPNKTDEE